MALNPPIDEVKWVIIGTLSGLPSNYAASLPHEQAQQNARAEPDHDQIPDHAGKHLNAGREPPVAE
jgi:hypothetical protein